MHEKEIGGTRLVLLRGDITEQDVDAIVNAANASLMGGGGVDGAIHRKGGPSIKAECRAIRESEWPDGLPTGRAVITGAGELPARFVIHTVGPIWRGGDHGEPELLADAYRNSIGLARERGLGSIAFPSISTGAYGYPIAEAARIALTTVEEAIATKDDLKEVRIVLFSDADLAAYVREAKG